MRAARECIRALSWASVMLLSSAASGEIYRWTQYGPDGLEARAITDGHDCPAAQVDGAPASMMIRAVSGQAFQITVCALPVPVGSKSLMIAGVPVGIPLSEPRHIVVLGDTGCRINGLYIQACNDPVQWPFRPIAEVAAHIKPDLVIHMGDYHYRESACPAGVAGCGGSPFGDRWSVWRADFFSPAETLLRVAPWVFVRGNHEACDRGGQGWSRTLAPYALSGQTQCDAPAEPFAVRLTDLTLAILDVSTAREEKRDDAQAEALRAQYKAVSKMSSGQTWILQHRPIWSAGGTFAGKLVGDNKTLAAAAKDAIPSNVDLILSGHQHLFQVLKYKTDLPVQVVAGHGGDYLNHALPLDPAGWTFGQVVVESGVSMTGSFGFLTLEKQDGGWQLVNHNVMGAALKSCKLKGRAATC
jgi:hypothetical protein